MASGALSTSMEPHWKATSSCKRATHAPRRRATHAPLQATYTAPSDLIVSTLAHDMLHTRNPRSHTLLARYTRKAVSRKSEGLILLGQGLIPTEAAAANSLAKDSKLQDPVTFHVRGQLLSSLRNAWQLSHPLPPLYSAA